MKTTISITAITKLKHTDLREAKKQFGTQTAFAKKLGIPTTTLNSWINLRSSPPKEPNKYWSQDLLLSLEAALIETTGKGIEELFPDEIRNNHKTLGQRNEQQRDFETRALQDYGTHTAKRLKYEPKDPQSEADIRSILKALTHREREAMKLLYGIDGEKYSYEETSKIMGISIARVWQIHNKSIRKMQPK